MNSPLLHDEVHELALDIVNASAVEDKISEWAAYTKLKELCEENESTELNHPFQWESLGDFTAANDQAISIYRKALAIAENLSEVEYVASINFALAERYFEMEALEQAYDFAQHANDAAKSSEDLELRKEISELLLIITKST